jgi:crossover junction endodeoxyribonuclease RusA
MITITLAYPPSANRLWRNTPKGTLKSAEYRAWLTEAYAAVLMTNPRPKVAGPYRMTLTADRPDRRRRDLSNLLKATEDALVHCQVVEDDSLAQSIHMSWSDVSPQSPGQIRVRIEAA